MRKIEKKSLAILRIAMGWVMLYAGWVKIADPAWSAIGYLEHAQTFPGFFAWFTQPGILPAVNFINEWGLFLLGISLILGAFVRLSSLLGALLMLLYYFPVLDFPHIPPHSYIVDDHLIYALVLLVFAAFRAGRYFGLDDKIAHLKLFRHSKVYERFLG